jgi:hypothetical protein
MDTKREITPPSRNHESPDDGRDQPRPALVDKRTAASFLGGLSIRTVDNLIARGELHPVKILRRRMIRVSELVALARRGTK